jgi:peptide/nickel transport system substrate-binding protein
MDRRVFLKSVAGAGAATAVGGLATPAISQRVAARALRYVPYGDLANFDPIWNRDYLVRDAGALVWDTLYGLDDKLQVQRQMVEAEQVSADGLTWTFRLRPGLKFHDGEPVRALDAVASLKRWSARDQLGQRIVAIEEELTAVDDRTFKWVLKNPFPKILLALGKTDTPIAFVMPERIAKTDPFRQITEYVGSGPMRFVTSEWARGAKAVFEKFPGYVPRSEPPSWLAGGKRMLLDRIEWIIIPDPASTAAALQTGEVDWWRIVIPDLASALRRNSNVVVDISDPFGQVGILRINHLYPPFNDERARRAILMALSQEDLMRAYVGDNDNLWKPMPGFFPPGTPLYNEEGGEILKGPRNFDAAKRLLADSGYAGQPITLLAAQDVTMLKVWSDVTADLLKRLGMKVDLVAVDFATVLTRRTSKSPPSQGGWHMYPTANPGIACANPATYPMLRANGDDALFGWPNSPPVEAEIAAWFEAKTLDEERAVARRLNKAALNHVVFAPLGLVLVETAWRKNITGIVKAPMSLFWGVSKTV